MDNVATSFQILDYPKIRYTFNFNTISFNTANRRFSHHLINLQTSIIPTTTAKIWPKREFHRHQHQHHLPLSTALKNRHSSSMGLF